MYINGDKMTRAERRRAARGTRFSDAEARTINERAESVCEGCDEAMRDEGFEGGAAEVAAMCRMLGADIPDHFCDTIQEGDPPYCGCACNKVANR